MNTDDRISRLEERMRNLEKGITDVWKSITIMGIGNFFVLLHVLLK